MWTSTAAWDCGSSRPVTFFPYAYSVIYGVMKGISTNLEYAAYNMGATRWQVFRPRIIRRR